MAGRANTPQNRIGEWFLSLALQPRNLAKSLGSWLPETKSHGITVMALDGQWLKVLQAEGLPSNRRITKLAACPVAGAKIEEIRKSFIDLCTIEGLSPKDVLIANPTHLSTIRIFSLPSTDPKEIRDIVELQAEKHTPYAKEEILTGFRVTGRERSGYSRVLLLIAHHDVVQRPCHLVELAGLTLDRVGCELEGLVNWYHLVRPDAGSGTGASLIVDVDGGTTTLLVVQRGQPQFHRSLAMGAEQLESDPAGSGERLVNELQRSLEAIEAEGGIPKVQDVLLTGRSGRLDELKTLMEERLSLPVATASPFAGREASEAVQTAAQRLPELSFASLAGLATAPSYIDLTPAATKLRQVFEARAGALVLLGCQGIGLLILLSLFIMGRAQKERRYYETLRGVYSRNAPQALKVEEALRQMEFIKERLHRRGRLLDSTAAMAKVTPAGVDWSGLTFSQEDGLILKGTSVELPKIYEFIAALNNTSLFGNVEERRVAKRKSGDRDVTDFEISCPFPTLKAPPTKTTR